MSVGSIVGRRLRGINFFAVFLVASLLAALVIYLFQHVALAEVGRIPNPKAGSTDTLRIYVSATGNDNRSGLSEAMAIKTIKKASDIAQAKWDEGLARGDVEVRFMNNPVNINWRYIQWFFAPAQDKYVRFMPAWYANDADADSRPKTDWPLFSGQSDLSLAAMPIWIEPKENKGGSFEFMYLRFEYFNNGIFLNGGVPTTDPDALDPGRVDQGVRMGSNTPIKKPIFRNLTFTNMGNKHVPHFELSYGSVRPWNTDGAIVRKVEFKNLEEDPITRHIHAVYGYHARNTIVEDSLFDNVTSDAVRYRHGGGWVVRNNTFTRAGNTSNISEWFVDRTLDETYVDDAGDNRRRFSECAGVPAVTDNNTTDGLNYGGLTYYSVSGIRYPFELHRTLVTNEPAPCTASDRVFTPKTSGQQTGEGTYKISWTTPATLSGSVARYKIYTGDGNDNKGQLVATVPVGTNTYTLSNLADSQDLYFYVLAEGTSGGVSPRTDNRLWFNLTPYMDVPDTTKPTVSIPAPTGATTVDKSVTITAQASDNKAVTKVEFYQGTTLLGTDTSSPYSYTWDTTNVAEGTYTVTAKAYDAAGNTQTSSPVSVTVEHPQAPVDPTPVTQVNISTLPSASSLPPELARAILSVTPASLCGDIANVNTFEPSTVSHPENIAILGGLTFTLKCIQQGGHSEVFVQLGRAYADTSLLRFYKHIDDALVDITDKVTVATSDNTTTATFTLTDGGELDEDGKVDGQILDPIYLGIATPAEQPGGLTTPVSPVTKKTDDRLAETGGAPLEVVRLAVGALLVATAIGGIGLRKLMR